jgi:dTDP-4-amino-4,6-dideoxygalactose transaminase
MLKKPAKTMIGELGVAYYESNWPGLQDGDEVLATPLTCTATNFPILANNLNLKWVDIDPKTLNMDLDDLSRKITAKTKVIFLVHWGGYPMDLDKLKIIQEKAYKNFGFKPAIIEDCAHALGSTFNGKPLGTHGNICTYSLQAIKHCTSVDGGVLIVPHKELYRRAKLLRWYGIDRESDRKDFRCEADIPEWGFKFHMNDVNASIGKENLKEVRENVIAKHKSNGKYYDEALKGVKGVTLLERDERMDSAYWIYSLLVEDKDKFTEHMKNCGITTSQVHERNDIHSCLSKYRTDLPNLDKIKNKLTAIPVGWWVSNEEREYIVECIKKGW